MVSVYRYFDREKKKAVFSLSDSLDKNSPKYKFLSKFQIEKKPKHNVWLYQIVLFSGYGEIVKASTAVSSSQDDELANKIKNMMETGYPRKSCLTVTHGSIKVWFDERYYIVPGVPATFSHVEFYPEELV